MMIKWKLEAIDHWQNNVNLHPLTCGNNSDHLLIGVVKCFETFIDVILFCPKCFYEQENVPYVVYEFYNDHLKGLTCTHHL